jgi:pyrroloquinoline quinone biosynthesis protein B
VVLTGGEVAQVAGLLSFREGSPFTRFATSQTHAAVFANGMFSVLAQVTRRRLRLDEPFALPGGIEAELFAVPGKAPLYLEGEAPSVDSEGEGNVGIELRYGDARLDFTVGGS